MQGFEGRDAMCDSGRPAVCYLPSPRCLASKEGTVIVGVCLCFCVSAQPRLHAACHISLRGEGNSLYLVLSSQNCVYPL